MFRGRQLQRPTGRNMAAAAAQDAGLMRQLAAAAAMDASGGSSGLAFLQAQLELVRPRLVEPLSAVTHPRDIPVTFGGGFVELMSAFASDYGSVGSNQYGLQGTSNTDIPMVQANVEKGTWRTFIWAASSLVTDIDLKKLAAATASGIPAPFSLEKLYRNAVQLVWNKALDKVTYTGWLGTPGLVNNPNVTAQMAAVGAKGLRTWASKTPLEIQADINAALLGPVENGGFSLAALPDRILIGWDKFNLLNQPFVLGQVGGYASVMAYILDNNIAKQNGIDLKILPLSNPWINGAGTGGSDRMVAYRNDEDTLELHIPAPMAPAMTVPSVKDGGSYETIWNGNIGQVQFFREQAVSYTDGI